MIDRRLLVKFILIFSGTLATAFSTRIAWVGAAIAPREMDRRENCSFIQEFQKLTREAVIRGEITGDAFQTVYCPLCEEKIVISAMGYLGRSPEL